MEEPPRSGAGADEASDCVATAERLLRARDLLGSKFYAERSLELDPLVPGDPDRILAVAGVLLASDDRRVAGMPDWYAVLGAASDAPHADLLHHFRRLALLLRPPSPFPYSDAAFALVQEAWCTLSDAAKRPQYDAERRRSPPAAAEGDFWTRCPQCWHTHQYVRRYLGRRLRCSICKEPFAATEMEAPPPVVPRTDMYYCSWGFFPLGISAPMETKVSPQKMQPTSAGGRDGGEGTNGSGPSPQPQPPPPPQANDPRPTRTKRVASKRVSTLPHRILATRSSTATLLQQQQHQHHHPHNEPMVIDIKED